MGLPLAYSSSCLRVFVCVYVFISLCLAWYYTNLRVAFLLFVVAVSLSHAAVTCPSETALAAEEAEKKLQQETAAYDENDREKSGAKADSGEEDPSEVPSQDGGDAGEGGVDGSGNGQGNDAADAGEQEVPRDGKAVAGEAEKETTEHDDEGEILEVGTWMMTHGGWHIDSICVFLFCFRDGLKAMRFEATQWSMIHGE